MYLNHNGSACHVDVLVESWSSAGHDLRIATVWAVWRKSKRSALPLGTSKSMSFQHSLFFSVLTCDDCKWLSCQFHSYQVDFTWPLTHPGDIFRWKNRGQRDCWLQVAWESTFKWCHWTISNMLKLHHSKSFSLDNVDPSLKEFCVWLYHRVSLPVTFPNCLQVWYLGSFGSLCNHWFHCQGQRVTGVRKYGSVGIENSTISMILIPSTSSYLKRRIQWNLERSMNQWCITPR